MRVRDIMSEKIHSVGSQTTLRDAARLMREHDVGMLPVVDGGYLQGVVTDRDIVVRGLSESMRPEDARVKAVMSRDTTACHLDDDIQTAARLMEKDRLRRLVVLDGEEKPTGVLSLGDLARAEQTGRLEEHVLEEVSRAH